MVECIGFENINALKRYFLPVLRSGRCIIKSEDKIQREHKGLSHVFHETIDIKRYYHQLRCRELEANFKKATAELSALNTANDAII